MGLHKTRNVTPITDDDYIAASQSPSGSGNLTLNGVGVTGGVAFFYENLAEKKDPTAHLITITSGGNDTGRTFTITGKDERGLSITDAVTGASGAAATSAKYFSEVSNVAINGASAGTVKVGVAGKCVSGWICFNLDSAGSFKAGLSVYLTGTINAKVRHCFDQTNSTTAFVHIFDHEFLTNLTASADGNYEFPVAACQLVVNSSTSPGAAKFAVLQNS